MKKSPVGIIFGKVIGFLLFLIFLSLALSCAPRLNSPLVTAFLQFLNQNIGLILLYSAIFMVGELCSLFIFPFNLIAPPVNAIASLYLVGFIFLFLEFLEQQLSIAIIPFPSFKPLITSLVFLIVLVVGIVKAFTGLIPCDTKSKSKSETRKPTPKSKARRSHDHPDWSDIGQELRLTILDALKKARKDLK